MERERQAGDGGGQNPKETVAHNCLLSISKQPHQGCGLWILIIDH